MYEVPASPGPTLLAMDNLQGALKAVCDQVADWLGRNDADESVDWNYHQRGGKPREWLVGIELIEAPPDREHQITGVGVGAHECSDLGRKNLMPVMPRNLPIVRNDVYGGNPPGPGLPGIGDKSKSRGVKEAEHRRNFQHGYLTGSRSFA